MITYLISLTLLAGAVMLLRAVFRKSVSSKVIYAMWLAVVLRLCLPFDFILLDIPSLGKLDDIGAVTVQLGAELSESEPVLFETAPGYEVNVQTEAPVIPVVPVTPVETQPILDEPVATSPAPVPDTPVSDIVPGGAVITPETRPLSPTAPVAPEVPNVQTGDAETVSISLARMLDLVWLGGAVATFAVFAASWLIFNGKLVRSRRFYGRDGRVKIYVSGKISSPCIAGIVPKIYITPELEKSEHLSVVLLHEKSHLRQGDHIWSLVRIAAVSVHWWNPIIWAAAILSKRDAELACDERVAKALGSREKLEYARLLVDMTPVRKNYALSFAGTPIKERVLKLTREHKNKLIVAAAAVVLVACCLVIAFIGDKKDVPAETTESATEMAEPTEDAETTDAPESSKDPYSDPVGVYGMFEVYEATEENRKRFSHAKEYDISTGEYSFSMIMVPDEDIADFKLTRLTWNEELLVEGEEVIEDIGEVKAGEAILLTTDSVEIIGYTGISYTKDGETVRYYPATSGKDGSAILVEIGGNLMSVDMLYPGLPRYEVTLSDDVSIAKLISELPRDIDKQTGFYYDERKVLTVYGLSVPVHIEFGKYNETRSFTAYGKTVYNTGTWGETNYGSVYELSEYNGAVIISCDHYNMYVNTAVFTPEEVSVFDSESGVSTNIEIHGDDLVYERVSVKFKRPVTQTATAPLDLTVSRDEFFKETGMARIENGKLVLEEPDESFTIGESYDLDALFEEYKLNYLGYESADEVLERNRKREAGEEEPLTNQPVIPDESYVGNWNDLLDGIDIWEITEDTIKFSSGQFRLFGFDGTATLTDGKWIFVEDNDYVTDEDKIRGRLEFTDTSVSVIYDTDGRYDYIKSGHTNTFTRHMVKSEEGREYSGLIHRCYGQNGYGNPYLGFYKLTFVPVDESYSVIEELKICNGECEQSDGSPIAEYGVEDGWQYPVKVYDTKFDESLKDTYPTEYIDSKRTSMYVFDIGDGMHFKLTITRFDSKNFNNLLENEQELLDNIARCCYLEYTLLDGKTGEVGYNSGIKTAEVSAEHLTKAETDIRYKWITSFIGKDIEGCAEVLADGWPEIDYYKELMAPLEKLEFGSYLVVDIEDEDPASHDSLLFEFTVIRSDYDVYPVGFYKVNINKNLIQNFALAFIEKPQTESLSRLDDEVISKAANDLKPVTTLFDNAYNVNYPEDPYGDEKGWLAMSEHIVHTYVDAKNGKYYHTYGDGAAATLSQVANRILSNLTEDYKLHKSSYFLTPDGDYTTVGHGGTSMVREIVGYSDNITAVVNGSAEIFYVDVRYYSDVARFSEAFTVRYTFDRVASVYGLVLHGIEKISDNGYTACGFTS